MKKLSVLLITLISGCSSINELQYNNEYTNVIDYTKDMVTELSSGADKLLSHNHDNLIEHKTHKEFRTKFFPNSGIEGVITSYNNYCNGIKGNFVENEKNSYKEYECNIKNKTKFLVKIQENKEITSYRCSGDVGEYSTFKLSSCDRFLYNEYSSRILINLYDYE